MLKKIDTDLYNTKNLAILTCNIDTEELIWANTTFYKWYEQKPAKTHLTDVFPALNFPKQKKKLNDFPSCSLRFTKEETNLDIPLELICSIYVNEDDKYLFIQGTEFKAFIPEKKVDESKPDISDSYIEAYKSIRQIFNTIDDAIIEIDHNLLLSGEFNLKAKAVFGDNISGKTLSDLLNLSEKATDEIPLSINLLQNQLLEWEDFISLNNEVISVNNDYFELNYKLLSDINESQIRLLLIIKDVTKKVHLEQAKEKDASLQRMVLTIVKEQESFARFLTECHKIIQTLMYELEQEVFDEVRINNLFRAVHTIKGNASAFDMVSVTDLASKAEDSLRELRSQVSSLSMDQIDELRELALDLIDEFNFTKEQIAEILGPIFKDWESGNLSVSKEKVDTIIDIVKNSNDLEKHVELTEVIKSFYYKPVKSLLTRYVKLVEELSEKCHKPLHDLKIIGGEIELHSDVFAPLFESLVHIFRNAVDHGIEPTHERIDAGKEEMGHIKVTVIEENDFMSLIIEDDGGGINPDKIRSRCLEKKLITEDESQNISDEKIIYYILKPGFSTSNKVTDVSGNGVGMDAVKYEIEKLGGDITIESIIGIGTRFIIDLPED